MVTISHCCQCPAAGPFVMPRTNTSAIADYLRSDIQQRLVSTNGEFGRRLKPVTDQCCLPGVIQEVDATASGVKADVIDIITSHEDRPALTEVIHITS